MQIKRFEAADMAEALRLIKREFGPEAVILSANSLRKERGIFGHLKKPGVEVTAATDNGSLKPNKSYQFKKTRKADYNQSEVGAFRALHEKKGVIQSIQGEIKGFSNRINPLIKRNRTQYTNTEELSALYQLMLNQGVKETIASDLIRDLNKSIFSSKHLRDEDINPCLTRILERKGIAVSPIRVKQGKRKVVVFVGPTGVGKTTTVASLAAIHALRMGNRVALITLDNYRIAASEQLRLYARIIGVPIEFVSNKKELKISLSKFEDKDLVLIDTPGMSQRDENRIRDLKDTLGRNLSLEIHLLLSAAVKEKDLSDIVEGFKDISIDRLIFTKIDETTTYGAILNQLLQTKIPVSYFTNGQQVPGDIQIASLDRLVDLVTNKEKSITRWSYPHTEVMEMSLDGYGATPNTQNNGSYVANKNSDVFHEPGCRWAKKIKQENMILFESVTDAREKDFKACRFCRPGVNEKQNPFPQDSDKKMTVSYG